MNNFLKKRWLQIALPIILVLVVCLPAQAQVAVIQAPPSLDDLVDVNAPSPSDDDSLTWDAATSRWIPEAVSGGAGGLWEVDGGETQLITPDELDLQSYRILNVTNPSLDQDAATKKYVDDEDAGLQTNIDTVQGNLTTHEADTSTHGVTGDIVGTTDSQTLSNKTLGSNLDFATYTAIALTCDNGATLPTSPTPVAGQWFLHTPTGRNILYQYDGSNWGSIISIGTMTVYVDNTDGTDDLNYGTGVDSNAFATIQYAIDCIPGTVGGSVSIYLNDETYNEDIVVLGKNPSGNYEIYIYGTLSEQETVTSATVAAGTGATQGTVTKAGAFTGDSYANLLCYFVTDAGYRIIDSHTDDVLTLVGTAPSSTAQNVIIYDWGTLIDSLAARSLARVTCYGISLTGTGTWTCLSTAYKFNNARCYWCKLGTRPFISDGTLTLYETMVHNTGGADFDIAYGSKTVMEYSKLWWQNTAGLGQVYNGGILVFRHGSIIDGDAGGGNKATYGWRCYNNGAIKIENTASTGYCRIRNCDIGLYAYAGGMIVGTTNNQYLNNGDDEDAEAASFGYVD